MDTFLNFHIIRTCVGSSEGKSHKYLWDWATRSFISCFISFYISRYHFSQVFRTSFHIIGKNDFRHEFSFLTDSLKPALPPPLQLYDQNLLGVMKIFCWCSLSKASKWETNKTPWGERWLKIQNQKWVMENLWPPPPAPL